MDIQTFKLFYLLLQAGRQNYFYFLHRLVGHQNCFYSLHLLVVHQGQPYFLQQVYHQNYFSSILQQGYHQCFLLQQFSPPLQVVIIYFTVSSFFIKILLVVSLQLSQVVNLIPEIQKIRIFCHLQEYHLDFSLISFFTCCLLHQFEGFLLTSSLQFNFILLSF